MDRHINPASDLMVSSLSMNGIEPSPGQVKTRSANWPVSVLLDIHDSALEMSIVETLRSRQDLFIWTSLHAGHTVAADMQAPHDPHDYDVVLADRLSRMSPLQQGGRNLHGPLIYARPEGNTSRLDLVLSADARLDQNQIRERLIDYLVVAAEEMLPVPEHLLRPEVKKWCPVLARMPKLNRSEILVLRSLGLGETNEEAASRLNISIASVKTLMRRILQKLELENRTQVAVFVASMTTYNLRLKAERQAYQRYH